ncbi:alkanesulfonate monooxygenase SsuD/methylene tetrahydromethanopterin reductase-like flavin-dependent oxidoreductase (luciferase family) [Streptomyces phaeochromogenes]|uniref:LLM class flavin-dependent oxidoreductase n=1 Tax=Streptomyces phaeochromogenes TaxID=1923 RepID=UPI002793174A|nr:LLM class flavin-dependent oxidoreductase [Streptomyces phaeochromogenes]MDQ0946634.1 alkanesulfonate monooxygenase SsuD/methylene tetrahydromethanopterin reductase-like flavin-dependent oxidoreductase (luciferase family) [Streptomyces phaeochromogenes]
MGQLGEGGLASRRRRQAVRRHGQDPAGQPTGQARSLPRPAAHPPSEQGQPVIFQAGGGSYGLELAGRYASGVYANPYAIEDARAQRQALQDAAKRAGRDPDEVKMLAGFMPTIAPSHKAALSGAASWTRSST